MAAYAALVSLNFIINQVPHSLFPDKSQIQSLENKIEFLEKFLEDYSPGSGKETSFQALEIEIRDVSNAAEDMIESYVLDQTVLKQPGDKETNSSTIIFFEDLQKVMEELESIEEKAMKIKVVNVAAENQQPQSSTTLPGVSARSVPGGADDIMVGFDKHLEQIMDQITRDESDLQILPVVGMAGIGKTTLTRKVFDNQFIKDQFEIRLWSTISQSYDLREIYLSFLQELGIVDQKDVGLNELGLKLYQNLLGTRYLVILDDVWSVQVWNELRTYFPSNGNRNRVIISTRLLGVASDIATCKPYELEFLNHEESWNLLEQKVFAGDECPSLLEGIGRDIAASCRGLPLTIVVIAGQLVKSNMTEVSWKHVAGAINSLAGNDDHCIEILSLSYDHLPVYLKPCFLYIGTFPEDSEVRVSSLVKSMVAEGFLKSIGARSLEESAREYLKDLVERNLILVGKRGSSGNFKSIHIHDLLRDLCIKEGHKQNFLCVKRFHSLHIPHNLHTLPGIEIKRNKSIYRAVSNHKSHPLSLNPTRSASSEFSSLKLLGDLNVADVNSPEKNLLLIGSRCLTLSAHDISISLASLPILWNLQSLIMEEMLGNKPIVLPPQIWEMPLLRHIEILKVALPNPPNAELVSWKTHRVLENMHTLLDVHNFHFGAEVQRRIPNLKKLKVTYTEGFKGALWPFFNFYCPVNLVNLHKLESLSCTLHMKISMAHMSFPPSLEKLTLNGGEIPWEDITIIGQLPNLVVLRLHNDAFIGKQWTTTEGEFAKLKSLHLENVSLENWETESSHFPELERLSFRNIWELKEIPPSFEESTTLESISFEFCSTCLVNSAKQIKEQQADLGNTGIQVKEHLTCDTKDQLVVKLKKDASQLKVILDNLMKKQIKEKKQSKLVTQILHLIFRAEDISDRYMTELLSAQPGKSSSYFNKLYEIAKDVEFQLGSVSSGNQFKIDQKKGYSANLTVAHGEGHHHSKGGVVYEDVDMCQSLLNTIGQLLLYHGELILGSRELVVQLESDLRLIQDIIKETIRKRSEDESHSEMIRQIREVVQDAEDTVDTIVTQATRVMSMNYFAKLFKPPELSARSSGLYGIAQQVNELRTRIQSIYGEKGKLDGALLNIDYGAPEQILQQAPIVREKNIVGFEDVTDEMVGYLKEEKKELDVISIIGMPGLGKTTIVSKIFHDPRIVYEFSTRIWVYVSQQFSRKNVLLSILKELTNVSDDMKSKSDQDLVKIVATHLDYGRFLLVLDDVWRAEDWGEIKKVLPMSNSKGKIMITSRNMEVGNSAIHSRMPHRLRFLTEEESWQLLQQEVFGTMGCPKELKVSGKLIVDKCKGLPLAIVVIGGILAKKVSATEDVNLMVSTWETVCKNVSEHMVIGGILAKKVSATEDVNLMVSTRETVSKNVSEHMVDEDSSKLLEKVIALRYDALPYQLRECFLYLGMFPEDAAIPAWRLTCMWIAEGFIQQKENRSLEEVAESYLEDLINSNLLIVDVRRRDGKVKTCRIHDMVRDFCRYEAGSRRENFLQEIKWSADQESFDPPVANIRGFRRVCIHSNATAFASSKLDGPRVRSFVHFSEYETYLPAEHISTIPAAFKLLRVLDVKPIRFPKLPKDMFQLVHLRYLTLSFSSHILPQAFTKLLNIETLIVDTTEKTLEIKADIWKMKQLRHFKTNASASLPVPEFKGSMGSENIITLGTISPASCTALVFDRVRKVKRLGIRGRLATLLSSKSNASFDNLGKLRSVEKLKLINNVFPGSTSEDPLPRLPALYQFPPNMKSLTLAYTFLDWNQMIVLGQLIYLKVLKLNDKAFMGETWNAVDGGFHELEALYIGSTDLVCWTASAHHFPSLRSLELKKCEKLNEVPIELAGIQSFKILDMYCTKKSAATSARNIRAKREKMQEEQPAKYSGLKLTIFPPEE